MRDPMTPELFITPFMAKSLKLADGDVIETVLGTRVIRVNQPLPMMEEQKPTKQRINKYNGELI